VSAAKRRKREFWQLRENLKQPSIEVGAGLRLCRSELAREKPIGAVFIQETRVIVDVFREQARSYTCGLSTVALLEFLLAAARAGIVATYVLQRIAHRLLVSVAAVRAVNMAVVVIMVGMIMVVMIVVAVRTMDMGLLCHRCCSGIKSPGIISPLCATCTSLPMNNPVFSSPSKR
jgi:hypothetical protein